MIKNINDLKKRVDDLEAKVEEQKDVIDRLTDRVLDLERSEDMELPMGYEGQDD